MRTHSRWTSALLLSLAAFGPLVATPAVHAATVAVEVAPAGPMPPPIAETRPAAPGTAWHWVPGHWVWKERDVRWEWRAGHWVERDVAPPPPAVVEAVPPAPVGSWVWIQGHWAWGVNGWHWVKGHYVRR